MGILDRLKREKRTSKEECSGIVSNHILRVPYAGKWEVTLLRK